MFEKIGIFFMTGTGNSYQVATWFAQVAAEFGIPIKMQHVKMEKIAMETGEKTMCVFALPMGLQHHG